MKQSDSISTLSEETINDIVRRLVSALSPRAIYLFGSQLYGEPTRDSDIDVLIIVADDAANHVELARQGYACLHGLGLPVELHFASESRFQRFSTVIGSLHREVRNRGKVLYAA
jgi:predicted nucleotidyltransferase